MSYKDLLVLIDGSKACDRRIEAAVALAASFGAHVTGLSIAISITVPEYVRQQVPAEVLTEQDRALREQARLRAERFQAMARAADLNHEVRIELGPQSDLLDLVAMHARYSDLLVLGQHDPDEQEWLGGRYLTEQIVLTCGRPALLVPYIGAPAGFGKRVMIAWDAGREAARAVSDALPILRAAEQVVVLTVNPRSGPQGHGELAGADVATYLARHGVKLEVQQTSSHEINIADTLLSRIADQGIDLLVMGAYGHARWRELILGGVTQGILGHMTVPVLMSH